MGNEMTCRACGAPLKPGAKFCDRCGAKVEAEQPKAAATPNFCASCGAALVAGAKFCAACGAAVKTLEQPEAWPAAVADATAAQPQAAPAAAVRATEAPPATAEAVAGTAAAVQQPSGSPEASAAPAPAAAAGTSSDAPETSTGPTESAAEQPELPPQPTATYTAPPRPAPQPGVADATPSASAQPTPAPQPAAPTATAAATQAPSAHDELKQDAASVPPTPPAPAAQVAAPVKTPAEPLVGVATEPTPAPSDPAVGYEPPKTKKQLKQERKMAQALAAQQAAEQGAEPPKKKSKLPIVLGAVAAAIVVIAVAGVLMFDMIAAKFLPSVALGRAVGATADELSRSAEGTAFAAPAALLEAAKSGSLDASLRLDDNTSLALETQGSGDRVSGVASLSTSQDALGLKLYADETSAAFALDGAADAYGFAHAEAASAIDAAPGLTAAERAALAALADALGGLMGESALDAFIEKQAFEASEVDFSRQVLGCVATAADFNELMSGLGAEQIKASSYVEFEIVIEKGKISEISAKSGSDSDKLNIHASFADGSAELELNSARGGATASFGGGRFSVDADGALGGLALEVESSGESFAATLGETSLGGSFTESGKEIKLVIDAIDGGALDGAELRVDGKTSGGKAEEMPSFHDAKNWTAESLEPLRSGVRAKMGAMSRDLAEAAPQAALAYYLGNTIEYVSEQLSADAVGVFAGALADAFADGSVSVSFAAAQADRELGGEVAWTASPSTSVYRLDGAISVTNGDDTENATAAVYADVEALEFALASSILPGDRAIGISADGVEVGNAWLEEQMGAEYAQLEAMFASDGALARTLATMLASQQGSDAVVATSYINSITGYAQAMQTEKPELFDALSAELTALCGDILTEAAGGVETRINWMGENFNVEHSYDEYALADLLDWLEGYLPGEYKRLMDKYFDEVYAFIVEKYNENIEKTFAQLDELGYDYNRSDFSMPLAIDARTELDDGFAEFIAELPAAAEELRDEISLTALLGWSVENGMVDEIGVRITIDGESVALIFSTEGENYVALLYVDEESTITISHRLAESGDVVEGRYSALVDDGYSVFNGSLSTSWNRSSGDLAVSIGGDDDSERFSYELDALLFETSDGVEFAVDLLDTIGEDDMDECQLKLTATRGANIAMPEFVDLPEWDQAYFDEIEEAVESFDARIEQITGSRLLSGGSSDSGYESGSSADLDLPDDEPIDWTNYSWPEGISVVDLTPNGSTLAYDTYIMDYLYDVYYVGGALEPGVAQAVPIDPDYVSVLLFRPSTSGYYGLQSSGEGDPYVDLYSADGSWVGSADDIANGNWNFYIEEWLEAGTVYVFEVGSYDDDAIEQQVALYYIGDWSSSGEPAPSASAGLIYDQMSWSDEYSTYLLELTAGGTRGIDSTYLASGTFDLYLIAGELEADTRYENIPTVADTPSALIFTVPQSGTYVLESFVDDFDPFVNVYHGDGYLLATSDDSSGLNFRVEVVLEAGETVVFEVCRYAGDDGDMPLATPVALTFEG